MPVDYFGIITRTGAILVALILVATSIGTLKVINDNDNLVKLRDYDGPVELSNELKALQGLIILTQSAASWIIVLSCLTLVVTIISLVLVIANRHPTAKLVVGILEIVLICLGMLCFLATGIACAAYTASWGKPPEPCELADRVSTTDKSDICDSVPLAATNSVQAALSFSEIGVFGAVILAIVFSLQARHTTTTTSSWPVKSQI